MSGSHRPLRLLALLTIVLATLFAAVPARSAPARPVKEPSALSERLQLLAQPSLQGAGAAARARALSLPQKGAGSLVQSTSGEVMVYIQVASTDSATVGALRSAGARVVHVSDRYGVVTAYAAPARLQGVASVGAVRYVQEALAPRTEARATGQPSGAKQSAPAQVGCPTAITSEADTQLRADEARALFGVDGAGITVGALSDSYDVDTLTPIDAADDEASGDLPGPANPCGRTTPVVVLEESFGEGIDEGRAMLQLVHDIAPGAELAFASAFNGLFSFADNIRRLRSEAGADIIVDDVGYFEEPIYQDGPVSVAISDVVADGALYFSSAGNGSFTDADGNQIGSYEAPSYRPAACPILDPGTVFEFEPGIDCHDYDPGPDVDTRLQITLSPTGTLLLYQQWAEPWFGVKTDIDIYLVDGDDNVLALGASGNTFTPYEILSYENTSGVTETVALVTARFSGTNEPRFKFIQDSSVGGTDAPSGLEYAGSDNGDIFGPTADGHSASADAFSVGAVDFREVIDDPASDPIEPQDFSSLGPSTILFEPVESIRPAELLPAPEVRQKPDFAATNGGQTTFFYLETTRAGANCDPGQPGSVCRFYGTSASAPNAAAVAALVKERAAVRGVIIEKPAVEEILKGTALPMAPPTDASGAGLLDALGAVGAVDEVPIQINLPLVTR